MVADPISDPISLEVTSLTANKGSQYTKEQTLIQNGITYIRTKDGLLNFANPSGGVTTPATIQRRPRRHRTRGRIKKIKKDSSVLDTEHWRIYIPKDWEEKPVIEGKLYFESKDGTKGFYISTLKFEDSGTKISEVIESLKVTLTKTLNNISDQHWITIAEKENSSGFMHELLLDNYDQSRHYRIIDKVLISLPIVVSAAFHDYACENITKSDAYFVEIIESLYIKEKWKWGHRNEKWGQPP